MFTLYPSSESMRKFIKNFEFVDDINVEVNANTKYPFQWMRVGESFAIELDYSKVYAIKAAAQYHKQKTGKEFKIIRHHEHNCAEVGRIK